MPGTGWLAVRTRVSPGFVRAATVVPFVDVVDGVGSPAVEGPAVEGPAVEGPGAEETGPEETGPEETGPEETGEPDCVSVTGVSARAISSVEWLGVDRSNSCQPANCMPIITAAAAAAPPMV